MMLTFLTAATLLALHRFSEREVEKDRKEEQEDGKRKGRGMANNLANKAFLESVVSSGLLSSGLCTPD